LLGWDCYLSGSLIMRRKSNPALRIVEGDSIVGDCRYDAKHGVYRVDVTGDMYSSISARFASST